MLNFTRSSFEPCLNRMFLQALVVGAFATVGLLSVPSSLVRQLTLKTSVMQK